ncbi:MAG TPA: NAD-dependent epimerase/dehydratase family protein [Xanthomonadaceae bacterium]|nr:NAD-dependent epimerase/dehydratase family protein [Xanthomonadaceae bacterium]
MFLSSTSPDPDHAGIHKRRALVFGASGQLGDALLPLLRDAHCDVLAVSRQQRVGSDGLRWIVGALDDYMVAPIDSEVVFSLGPLDAFARWQDRVGPVAPRVIAFGSTSVSTKTGSNDPAERDVAERLRAAEETLFTFGARHQVGVTVLRPTLVYGRGRDRTLSRIAALALRRGVFALPINATGLRQPVHTDDLAKAALAAANAVQSAGHAYDVPGGETLRFNDMVARTLAVLHPRPRLLRLPTPLFRAAVASAHGLGMIDAINPAMLDRLDVDLVFDAADARRDFGYAPRGFAPDAAMFAPTS